jgi:hypothetical protein
MIKDLMKNSLKIIRKFLIALIINDILKNTAFDI